MNALVTCSPVTTPVLLLTRCSRSIALLLLCLSCGVGCERAAPNITAIKGDRSSLALRMDMYEYPAWIFTNDDLLLCEFKNSSGSPDQAIVHFYLRNEEASGRIALRVSTVMQIFRRTVVKESELTVHVESGKRYSLAIPVMFPWGHSHDWHTPYGQGFNEFKVRVLKGNIVLDELSFTAPADDFELLPMTFRELE